MIQNRWLGVPFRRTRRPPDILYGYYISLEGVFNVNHKSVFHIILYQPLKCFIHRLNWYDFYFGVDFVSTTKVQHFLCMFCASCCTSRNGYHTCHSKAKCKPRLMKSGFWHLNWHFLAFFSLYKSLYQEAASEEWASFHLERPPGPGLQRSSEL